MIREPLERQWTMQTAFNAVCDWMLRPEGTRCLSVDPISAKEYCCYRNVDGSNACAVGVLIPDEEPADWEQDKPADDWIRSNELEDLFEDFNLNSNFGHMLCHIQKVHDETLFWRSDNAIRLEMLQHLANTYELEFNHYERYQDS